MVMTGMGTGREKKRKNRRAIFSTIKMQFHSLLKLRKVEKKKNRTQVKTWSPIPVMILLMLTSGTDS